ncbi:DUF1996 domain-containing protein [Streptomyces sp. NPDC055078]
MGRTSRKRSTLANKAIVASLALIMGGGGLVAVNVYASASEDQPGPGTQWTGNAGRQISTIDCPEVADALPPEMPGEARGEVDRALAAIDSQITDAYKLFADQKDRVQRDPEYGESAVLAPLRDKRQQSIEQIAAAIGRIAERPQGMEKLAGCTLRADDTNSVKDDDNGQNGGQSDGQNGGENEGQGNQDQNGNRNGENNQNGQGGQDGQGQNGGNADGGQGGGDANGGQGDGGQGDGGQGNGQGGGQAGNGPEASDFVDIRSVRPNVKTPRQGRGASRGTFATSCGVNANGLFNPDNVIVAPGVSNGAHHMHDYVGNQANDAFASDDDLRRGRTTCRNRGDRSSYFWPVLRLQNGADESDANDDGGGKDQNVGEIQTPAQVTMNFVGSPAGKVTAMPRLLRIITGDAKAFVNGPGNANASWSCTGFENRQLKDKYPICPQGSQVVRTFKFQSCWDGRNTDSANHRTHVAFADRNGRCARGFKAIPQLVQRIVYDVPPGPGFAVDSFPEQLHKPVTDHGDFINVFDRKLMNRMVGCINNGQKCR